MGILAFITGMLALLLPETLGRPLTTTLEEAEALGRKTDKKKDVLEMNQHEVKAWAAHCWKTRETKNTERVFEKKQNVKKIEEMMVTNTETVTSFIYWTVGKLHDKKQALNKNYVLLTFCFVKWPVV